MEEIKSLPALRYLDFNENHLKNVRLSVGYDEEKKLRQDIEQLDHWIRMQSHFRVKDYDSGYLERILICNKGSIERAKQKFDKLCTCINLTPEYLQNFEIRNEFLPIFKVANVCLLPKPTKNNYRVCAGNVTGSDDNDFNVVLLFRYLVVIILYSLNNDYCPGFEVIIDSRNMILSVLSKVNPIVVRQGLALITDTMGQRINKLHFISGSKLFDAFLLVAKQGFSKKLKERIIIHSNNDSVYEHIPREQLPKEFGGDERSLKDLSDMLFAELSSDANIERLKFIEKASTDESCRDSCTFQEIYSGMPGSFKKLCVD